MKTPNSLEEQMRSWTLRRPSPRIEQRLFGEGESSPGPLKLESHRHSLHLPWYQTLGASLVVCVVVMLTVVNVTHFATSGSSLGGVPFTLSNHSYAASLAMASAPVNSFRAPILGWTNERSAVSTIRSFDLLITNRLLR